MLPMLGVSAQTPLKIVQTSPKFWEVGVNPNLKAVSLTFDQELRRGFSSWLGRSSLAPELNAESAESPDGRTCTLGVNLQPGKVYVLGLNERAVPGVGFQTKTGVPLPPHYLVFQTAGAPTPEDAPPRAVSTIPANGTQQVDASKVKSVSITFDKPMQTTRHGLQLFENKAPVDLSKARFQYSPDGRTFSLAYDFKAAASYDVELNSTGNIGFVSSTRVPLWPGRVAFTIAPTQ